MESWNNKLEKNIFIGFVQYSIIPIFQYSGLIL